MKTPTAAKSMKLLITLTTLLLLSVLPCEAQLPKLASPVSLGIALLSEPTIEGMKTLCKSYQFTEAHEEDNFTVFTSSQGHKIRFRIYENHTGVKIPEIEVTSSKKLTGIKDILKNAGYIHSKTNKRTYTRGSNSTLRIETCTQFSHSYLFFTKTTPPIN